MKAKSPRIAIVAASAPPLSSGGVASAHYNLFKALVGAGYETRLFTFYDNDLKKVDPEPGIERYGAPAWLVGFLYGTARFFMGLLSGSHAHETAVILRSQIGAIRAMAALNRYKPDVVILSDHGAPGLFAKRKPGRLVLLVSHHNPMRFLGQSSDQKASLLDARIAVFLENIVLGKVDKVICPSRYMQEWFFSTYSYKKQIEVLPNIIDDVFIDSIQAGTIHPKQASISRFVYLPSVGAKIKGGDFTIPILTSLLELDPALGFYIPGYVDSQYKEHLSLMELSSAIYLPGQVSHREHISLMKSCVFGISPAIMENFSMAIYEAVFCGVPMLAFDAGGNEDIITNGENGFLVPAFDLAEMIAVARKLAADTGMANLKQNTLLYTREKLNSQRILRKYLAAMEIL